MISTRTHAEVIAHRGASAYRPEHTLAAYGLALEQGADRLELDVRPTADGELVVVHDPTLVRLGGGKRPVAELTLAEAREACDGEGPLTLDDVLGHFGTSARYLVELKDPDPSWETGVAAALVRHGLARHARLQTFDLEAVPRLRAASPWIPCGALCVRRPRLRTLDALAGVADGIGVWHRRVDAGLVAAAHARGLAVRAWTVNGPALVDRMLDLGVDGVITDAPDVAVEIVSGVPAPALAA